MGECGSAAGLPNRFGTFITILDMEERNAALI